VTYIPILNYFLYIAKKHTLLVGIIIFDIISAVLLFILPFYLFLYYGDIGVILGAVIGMIFTLRYCKPEKEIRKVSFYFILLGALLTSLTLSIIEWMITIPYYGLNFVIFLSLFVSNLIMVFVLTIIIGIFLGYYYSTKRANVKKSDEFDDFFAELEKK